MVALWQASGTVEDADVVQPEKAAGKQVFAFDVLAVDPPGEIDEEFVENPRQEQAVTAAARSSHLIDSPACPRVHRRINVAEIELVGRELAVGVHVPLAEHQNELLLREIRIDSGEWQHVKS